MYVWVFIFEIIEYILRKYYLTFNNNFNLKCQENPEEPPQPRELPQSEETREEPRPSPSISTESSSKFTQRPVSQEIHVYHELLHLRHLREDRHRIFQARQIQQEAHSLIQRSPDLRQTPPPRRACQACRLRGNQGCHQVLLRQVINLSLSFDNNELFNTSLSNKNQIGY